MKGLILSAVDFIAIITYPGSQFYIALIRYHVII